METVKRVQLKVQYNGTDITDDIGTSLLNFTYNDKVEGESDEIQLTVENSKGIWGNEWYPGKGDKLTAQFGFDGVLIDCGTFEIDELEASGPPDTITIRALAAGINSPLRSKKSRAFESVTLRQIAEQVATAQGLTVVGDIENIRFNRVTQVRQSDLNFLHRLAMEYGHAFSVRGTQLVFTQLYELEGGEPVITWDRSDLKTYTLKDKTSETFAGAKVSYHNPATNEVVESENTDQPPAPDVTTGDTLLINTRTETPAQATAKAKAANYRANSRQKEGTLSREGDPLALAGNNMELTGMGYLSGKYHITESTHSIDSGGGYETTISVKMVGFVEEVKRKTVKKPRQKKYRVVR